jgi:hypothetical protein
MESGGIVMVCTTLKLGTERVSITNLQDLWRARRGDIPAAEVRRITSEQSIIDRDLVCLRLPVTLIERLGLQYVQTRRIRTVTGAVETQVYDPVELEVQGRSCSVEVHAGPDNSPIRIGSTPLLSMDFVVDPESQQLIGNPAHGGRWEIEMYCQAATDN